MPVRKRCLVLGGAVAAALVALGAGSAAARNPWIVFGASPNHGTQAPQLFRVRVSGVGLSQITTGLHPDYHANTDDVSKIEFPKMTRITQLIYETALRVANLDHPPVRDNKGPRAGKGTP